MAEREQKEGERMSEKDKEMWLGESRFYLGDDNILYIDVVGELTDDMAEPLKEGALKLMNMVPGKVNVLADLNKVGIPSAKVREKGMEAAEYEKAGKVALFGMHAVARVIASFWIGLAKKKEIRFFKTKEEALAWLKE